MCSAHYCQWKRGEKLHEPYGNQERRIKHLDCQFDACDRKQASLGYCDAHYQQFKKGKELAPVGKRFPQGGTCTFEGCADVAKSRGLCSGHYWQWNQGRKLVPKVQRPSGERGKCNTPRCENFSAISYPICYGCKSRADRYGLSVADYLIFVEKDVCDICGSNNRLNIDHDHKCCPGAKTCGKCTRGLLCNSCNIIIAKIENGSVNLEKMNEYINRQV